MTDRPAPADLRRAPRHALISFVWYKALTGTQVEGIARAVDISSGGVGLVASRPVPFQTLVFLEIDVRGSKLSAVGTVVHCRPLSKGQFRWGVLFVVIPPNDRPLLERVLGG